MMLQTVEEDVERLKWPIAPDGYIPNSVIRSWRRRGKDGVEKMMTEKEVEKIRQRQLELYDDFDSLHCRVMIFDLGDMPEEPEEEEEEVYSPYSSRKNVKLPRKSCQKNEHKLQREPSEDLQPPDEVIIHPLQCPSVPSYHTTSGVTVASPAAAAHVHECERRSDQPRFLVSTEHPVVSSLKLTGQKCQLMKKDENHIMSQTTNQDSSAHSSRQTVNLLPTSLHENGHKLLRELREHKELPEIIIRPVQCPSGPNKHTTSRFIPEEPRVTLDLLPPTGPRNDVLCPPPSPEDLQAQPDIVRPECSSIRDKWLLQSPTKYDNIRDQPQVEKDLKAIRLWKKFKAGYNPFPHLRKPSTTAERHPASKGTRSNVPVNLKGGLSSSLLCSPRAARSTAAEHQEHQSLKTSDVKQPAVTIPSLQPGCAAAHQRVVQRVQMTHAKEPDSPGFHHIIPMPSQHGFFTLDPCGKTQYGRLQFEWVRGSDEDNLLGVTGVKFDVPAHKVVNKTRL